MAQISCRPVVEVPFRPFTTVAQPLASWHLPSSGQAPATLDDLNPQPGLNDLVLDFQEPPARCKQVEVSMNKRKKEKGTQPKQRDRKSCPRWLLGLVAGVVVTYIAVARVLPKKAAA